LQRVGNLLEKFGKKYHKQVGVPFNNSGNNFHFKFKDLDLTASVSNFSFTLFTLCYDEKLTPKSLVPIPLKKLQDNLKVRVLIWTSSHRWKGLNGGKDYPEKFVETVYERFIHLGLTWENPWNIGSCSKSGWLQKQVLMHR
jgi:hypothetical protein